jgi:hypothetical protein
VDGAGGLGFSEASVPLRRWRALALFLALLTAGLCAPFLFSAKVMMNRSDVFEHVGPFRHAAARELQAGRFPLWNPHLFCGVPFLGASQAAVFYPPSQLFYFFPLVQAVNVFAVLHFFLNAFGMALLLFRLSRSRAAAWLGATAWGFSHFFLGHAAAGHLIHLSAYAWGAFAGLFLAAPGGVAVGGLAAAASLCFLSGHLQASGQMGVVAAANALAAARGRRGEVLASGARALLATAALVAAQALPTAAFLLRSTRAGFLSGENLRRFAASYSLPPRALAAFFAPGLFGHPFDGTFRGGAGSVFFESYGQYLGLVPLALGLVGLVRLARRRDPRPWIGLLFLLIALGENGPVFPLLWRLLAGQRAPARWMVGFLWALVLAGAAALAKVPRGKGLRTALVLAAVLDVAARARPYLRAEDPAPYWSSSSLLRALPWDAGLAPRLALGLETPLEDKVMFYGFSSVGGYEAQVPADMASYVAGVEPGMEMPSTGLDVGDPSLDGYRLLDIRYALLSHPVPGWRPRARVGPGTLSENPAPWPVVRPLAGPARLLSMRRPSAERFDTRWEAAGPFTALWAEDFDPGWQAYAGGRRLAVKEAAGALQAVEVTASGPSTDLRWRYRPPSARAGIFLSLAAWAAAAAWGVARLRKFI